MFLSIRLSVWLSLLSLQQLVRLLASNLSIASFALGSVTGGGAEWLASLREIDLQKAIDALSTQLPGFGPKVAACIALFSLDQHQAIPVDTHVWQIATRYLIPELAGTRLTPKLCSRAVFLLRFESGKDVSDFVKDITSWFSAQKENLEIYLDHSGDPMIAQQSMVIIWWMKIQCSRRYEMNDVLEGQSCLLSYVLVLLDGRRMSLVFDIWQYTLYIVPGLWFLPLILDVMFRGFLAFVLGIEED
ncbi:hypothetical protein RHMOL_Rhmol09G0016700 [Rhododendron molle]|uniref:Uncharacterized protein n=2 Tax=Rhododendron molle TaxID=49168 RepID=A0ACC0M9A1_RHOML|nr:hypothetical protein RHMOL_Rhmol09G0016700 [Rhododendron molle]KAI8537347.1 hypothetical protein RHMOL_Rhmol09G0016700 [Rhododendron molle]